MCSNADEEKQPRNEKEWVLKGRKLVDLFGKLDEANRCYDEAIRINPNYAVAWICKGYVLSETGRFVDAIACYDNVIELDPPDFTIVWALNYKGVSLSKLGRFIDAIECYDIALNNRPGIATAELWKNKGDSLYWLGRNDDAKKCYETAVELEKKAKEYRVPLCEIVNIIVHAN